VRRRILLVSALFAAIMIIAAPAAFAQSLTAGDLDIGNLGRNAAGVFIVAGQALVFIGNTIAGLL